MMVRNPQIRDTVGVSNFDEDMLVEFITSDERFWSVVVKTKQKTAQVDLANYREGLQANKKKDKQPTLTEVDHKYMHKYLPEHPEVDINDDMLAIAKTNFPAF